MKTGFASDQHDSISNAPARAFLPRLLIALGLLNPAIPPAQLSEIGERVERLCQTRLGDLKLPPNIQSLFEIRSAAYEDKIMATWALLMALLNSMTACFSFIIVPWRFLLFTLGMRLLVIGVFLASFYLIRKRRVRSQAHLLVIIPCAIGMIVDSLVSQHIGSADISRNLLSVSMIMSGTAILFGKIHSRASIFLLLLLTLLLSWSLLASPFFGLANDFGIIIFYGLTMVGLLYARNHQTRIYQRLFLFLIRDEIRALNSSREHAQLTSIAYTDRLTDIPNRRHFDELAERINAAPEKLLPFTICMLDIDHFKNLNDRLGHAQGDRCLRVVATTIRNHLRRKGDVLARYGGEEFVLLLPNTPAQIALEITERIRLAILALNHPNPGTELERVSISAGIAAADQPVRVESLLLAADQALYRAKTSGRNQVTA